VKVEIFIATWNSSTTANWKKKKPKLYFISWF